MTFSKNIFYLSFCLMSILFLSNRLLYLGSDISFDHKHYMDFFVEISKIDVHSLLNNIVDYFPYVRWADFGKFEFGFALTSYPVTQMFNEQYSYVILASLSIFLKLIILRKYNVSTLFLLPFLIFSFSYFETNQLRASFAVIFLMYANYCYLVKDNIRLALFFNIIAMTFHLSSGFFLCCFVIHLIISKIKQKELMGVFYVLSFLFCIVFIGDIFLIVGGKLREYYIQAVVYGLYTGSSGINTVSIFLFFWVGIAFFVGGRQFGLSNNKFSYIQLVLLSMLILVLFSGPFAVLADRLWLMSFMVLYPFLVPPLIKTYPSKIVAVIAFGIVVLYVLLYLYISMLSPVVIYPNSNVFQFFNLLSLDSPEAY